MKNRILLPCCLLFTLTFALAGAATAQIPAGVYSGAVGAPFTQDGVSLSEGEYQVTFLDGGRIQLGRNDFIGLDGTYTISGQRIEITAPGASPAVCRAKGVYDYEWQGDKLVFKPVATAPDPCVPRAASLTRAPLTRVEPAAAVWKNIGPEGGRILALLPHGAKVFAAGDGGGVSVSDDDGQTWRQTRGIRGYTVNALAAYQNNLFAALTVGQFCVSGDGGENWVINNNGPLPANIFDFVEHNGRFYAATLGAGVYRLGDNPFEWEKAGVTGLTNQRVYTLVSSGNRLYAGTDGGGVFVSNDDGATWRAINNGIAQLRIRAMAVDGNLLYAGTAFGSPTTIPNNVYVSEDGGETWKQPGHGLAQAFPVGFTNAVYELAVHDGYLFAAGTSGVIIYNGNNWTWVHTGQHVISFFAVVSDGTRMFAGAWFNGVARS
ncbi:MAG: hypothetical protein ACKV2V_01780, partial [Blastocatellia bacterium]